MAALVLSLVEVVDRVGGRRGGVGRRGRRESLGLQTGSFRGTRGFFHDGIPTGTAAGRLSVRDSLASHFGSSSR